MAFLMKRDFHPGFPPLGGTLTFRGNVFILDDVQCQHSDQFNGGCLSHEFRLKMVKVAAAQGPGGTFGGKSSVTRKS
jgi:hypothetical protein